MRKLILLFSLLVSSLAFGQEEVPNELFGVYANGEGEVLTITRDLDKVVFIRKNAKQTLAAGTISMVKGELHIDRFDNKQTYNLSFFIGNEIVVIHKPNSTQAWIWNRLQ